MRTTALLISLIFFFACRKESFTSSPEALLQANTDTLHFDTVFATVGSITQSFKIFNDNAEGIHISSIELKGGSNSPFRMNVNGIPGPSVSDLNISGKDSLYVFVTVNINPTAADLPFVVRDSIEVFYNGNKKLVQLEAFGRNAHFLRSKIITEDEVWNSDLPYVILGGLEVAGNTALTINKGSQVYLHADAPFIVKGTLKVFGEKWDSTKVLFTGDRLDEPYRSYPASWPGIYFTGSSKDNILEYTVVKNAYQAVVVQMPSVNTSPKLRLHETIIDNAYDAGLLGVNTSIKARNLLISNSGKNLVLVSGGDYEFTHCTVASISNNLVPHNDPVLFISNYLNQDPSNSLSALFRNCIFWGDGGLVDNEVTVLRNGGNTFNVEFDHVLWKVKDEPAGVALNEVINNEDPLFDTLSTTKNFYSFLLKENSPAINKGINTSVTLDLNGQDRPVGLPDLGAYEKQ